MTRILISLGAALTLLPATAVAEDPVHAEARERMVETIKTLA